MEGDGRVMVFKVLLLVAIATIAVRYIASQAEKRNKRKVVWAIIGTIAVEITANYIVDAVNPFLPHPDTTSEIVETSSEGDPQQNISKENSGEFAGTSGNKESSDDSGNTNTTSDAKDTSEPKDHFEDITGEESISGRITEDGQINSYKYTAQVDGTYRFDADLSSGGKVRIRISGENEVPLDYGTNTLAIDLESGKTYILSIEYYSGVCEYTVNIGTPLSITDISNKTLVAGKITYQDQEDKYYYTAPTSGTYRFSTDLSSGGKVYVRISGENGTSLDYGTNALSIDLEAGKKYILSVEHYSGLCEYTVSIGVPLPITDISNKTLVAGKIAYQD